MAGNSSLKNLKMDQILKAFEGACKTFETVKHQQNNKDNSLTDVKLVLITEDYYEQALKFAREHFMPKEPINKALGMQWTPEVEEVWMSSLKLNLSLMFIDERNQEPMAFRATKIARPDDDSKVDLESIQSEPLRELFRYCFYCDEHADFFGHYGIEETFHFFSLAVADKYKQRGLGRHILKAAIEMIQNFGIDPVYVKVEGSSNFSKRIFETVGFETLFEQPFATWEVDGKIPIQKTGIHKSMKVYGMKLSSKP